MCIFRIHCGEQDNFGHTGGLSYQYIKVIDLLFLMFNEKFPNSKAPILQGFFSRMNEVLQFLC